MMLIPLVNWSGELLGYTAVDDADYDDLRGYRWGLAKQGYVRRGTPDGRVVLMHRQVMGFPPCQVDHWDRDRQNNQRGNLRLATNAQNCQNLGLRSDNTSGYRGVSRYRNGKWTAQCVIAGEHHFLGYHDMAELADEVVRRFRAEHMPYSQEAA